MRVVPYQPTKLDSCLGRTEQKATAGGAALSRAVGAAVLPPTAEWEAGPKISGARASEEDFEHGCQTAIARFLDHMCLALRA